MCVCVSIYACVFVYECWCTNEKAKCVLNSYQCGIHLNEAFEFRNGALQQFTYTGGYVVGR